jgi:CubicO group peptidase (beta-lactamase class C family)
VEQLLLHRGGLPKDALSRDSIRQPWPPGDRAEYSNLGYRLLAAVVEKVSAEPYPVVAAREILRSSGRRPRQHDAGSRAAAYSDGSDPLSGQQNAKLRQHPSGQGV